VLSAANAARRATVISGGGTKLSWGRTPARVDLVGFDGWPEPPGAHRFGDLTATIESGATLTRSTPTRQAPAMAAARQRVSVRDHRRDHRTNDSGPLRHRFGTPRDLLIGVTLVLADGGVVKAGGNVVKNVAGYDLGRLSAGRLEVSRSSPRPPSSCRRCPASGHVGSSYRERAHSARDAQLLASNQFELHRSRRAGARRPGVPDAGSRGVESVATDAQLAAVQRLVAGEAQIITGRQKRISGETRSPRRGWATGRRFGWPGCRRRWPTS
jgi:hypothetical protein